MVALIGLFIVWGRQNVHNFFIIFFHRFLVHLSCQSPALDAPANFCVVETNAFKHLNHLSLRLVQGCDKEVKDYLAVCLSSLKVGLFIVINPYYCLTILHTSESLIVFNGNANYVHFL